MQSISNLMGDSVQSRNRRMFGNLMGHLNQARTNLSRDQGLFEKQVKNLFFLALLIYCREKFKRMQWNVIERKLSSFVKKKHV